MRSRNPVRGERGITLIELMVALVVLAVGLLAVGGVFPSGTRNQLSDRMLTNANNYAQQKLEDLSVLVWSDPALTDGRYPAGTAFESLGSNAQWHRWYDVTTLAAPLDNLKKVTVTVSWNFMGSRQVTSTTYLRR